MNRPGRAAVRGGAAVAIVAVLPALASRSPVLQDLVRRFEPALPMSLIAVALAGGAWAAIVSWRNPAGGSPVRRGSADRERARALANLLGPAVAVAVFMLPLIRAWSDAPSDGGILFGLLPWSDGGNYYRGAEDLLETGRLDAWNCRRPLNAALLAVRLALSGHDIRGAQTIQAVLLGLSVFGLCRTVGRDLGWPSGLLAFAIVFAYARPYVPWLLSESLGVTFGALAFTLLWVGARSARKAALGWGMAGLTLALNARAGAFLVLPSLLLWAGWTPGGRKAFHWSAAAFSLAGVLFGFLANGAVMKIYGGRLGVGHGNFSMVLYGLASGHPGWTQIYRDYPEAWNMAEEDLVDFAYAKSYERMTREPARLLTGLASASRDFLSGIVVVPPPDERLRPKNVARWLAWILLGGGALVHLLRSGKRPETKMIVASLGGILLSVPFLWTDGEARVYAAILPALAVLASFGTCGWKRTSDPASAGVGDRERLRRTSPAALALAGLAAAALAGPALAKRVAGPIALFSPAESGDGESAVIRSDAPCVVVHGRESAEPTFVPRIRRFDYVRNLPAFAKEDFLGLPKPGAVFYARDRLVPENAIPWMKYVWVIGPAEMAGGAPRYLLLRGTYDRETQVFKVSGFAPLACAPSGRPRSGHLAESAR